MPKSKHQIKSPARMPMSDIGYEQRILQAAEEIPNVKVDAFVKSPTV